MTNLVPLLAEPPSIAALVAQINGALQGVQQTLFIGRGLDFHIATDQALTKVFNGTNWQPTSIVAVRKSGAASVACAGGLYDAASKGGNAIVAAAQSWVTLASGIIVNATLAALTGTALLTSAAAYLSLTTGSTAAVTADVFIFGVCLD